MYHDAYICSIGIDMMNLELIAKDLRWICHEIEEDNINITKESLEEALGWVDTMKALLEEKVVWERE